MNSASRCVGILTVLVVAGCSERVSTAHHTVRDSAGVQIVSSQQPAWSTEGWRLAEVPVVDIGTREGADEFLFDDIIDLRLVDDGGVVVANMGDNSVRRFGPEGRLVWRAGRSGEGPGEYTQVWRLRVLPNDQVLAVQSRDVWPDYVYGSDGTLLRSIEKASVSPGLSIFMADLFRDGSYLYSSWPQGMPVRSDMWTDSATLFVPSADGSELDSILRLPAMTFARVNERRGDPVQFGPSLVVAAGDSFFFANYPDEYDVEMYDHTGRMVRRIRRASSPQAVTPDEIERYRREYVDRPGEAGREIPQAERARRERLLETRKYAESYPAHDRMLVDQVGNLWIAQDANRSGGSSGFNAVYPDPTSWDVFDDRGVWLGTVLTPERFRVMDIHDNFVAGIWRDDVDVEHVRIYRLTKN